MTLPSTPLFLGLLALATLSAAPGAASSHIMVDPGQDASAGECINYGLFVQLGDMSCATCVNHGIVVWVGEGCWANAEAGACVGELCTAETGPPSGSDQAPPPDLRHCVPTTVRVQAPKPLPCLRP